jgi:serine/threonine protein kinase
MHEQSVFTEALEIDDPVQRAAFLEQACAGDLALRQRVERLLHRHEHAGSFLAAPAETAGAAVPSILEQPGAVIGNYKLLEQIGEGGFGVVFMAEQTEPVRRKVALKILKPGMDTRQIVARFEAERQALAIMDHPNIAKVLDGGATPSGRPYFVMELVKGVTVTEFCDQRRLTPRQRLELFIPICRAVQHAHQKGIIHRDLKPSNVLVVMHDTRPVPTIIDFGVAKALGQALTDKTLFTGYAQLVGTPLYMSPEQAGQSGLDIDTRSDIYALGVLLYELLTGTTPFDTKRLHQAAFDEMLRIIREDEPPIPSTRLSTLDDRATIAERRGTSAGNLSGVVRGELDWIVMKCLEKERSRRYETASGLAQDIEHFLQDEPVQACPPSTGYRVRKFVRRHRGQVFGASLVLLSLVAGMVGTSWGFVRAEQRRIDADTAREAEELRADGERRAKVEAEAARQAETERADEERRAKLAAEDAKTKALAALEAERIAKQAAKKANEQAQRRLKQVNNAYVILSNIFADLDIRKINADNKPVERVLADRLVKAGQQLDSKAIDDPTTLAALQHVLGASLLNLGFAPQAVPLLDKAWKTRKALRGPDDDATLASMGLLARGYTKSGQLKTALPLLEEALRRNEVKHGRDHSATLTTMNNLAIAYQSANRNDEALPLLKETYDRRRAKHGKEDYETLVSANNLANAYERAKKNHLALPLFEETLQLRMEKLGPNHPDTLTSMASLASFCIDAGLQERGIKLAEETLRLRIARLGHDHPDTLASMNNLASTYWKAKRLDQSVPLFEDTLKRMEAKHGRSHPYTLNTLANLGVNYSSAGRLKDALPLLQEAYVESRKHPSLHWVAAELLVIHLKSGDVDKAKQLIAEMVANARKDFPKGGRPLCNVLDVSGLALLNLKAYAEAEVVLQDAVLIHGKLDPDSYQAFMADLSLGAALLGQKKMDAAEAPLRRVYTALEMRDVPIPAQTRATLVQQLHRVVSIYEATGDAEKASYWRKLLENQRARELKNSKPAEKKSN